MTTTTRISRPAILRNAAAVILLALTVPDVALAATRLPPAAAVDSPTVRLTLDQVKAKLAAPA